MPQPKRRGRLGAPKASSTSTSLRTASPRDESGTARGPFARLLDLPHVDQLVPQLAPETLHALIRHGGLEACGALLASATREQLTSVADLDLWRNAQPGLDEQFDADRFGEWLEVLADIDGDVAARVVADLNADLVITGLSRYIRVLDPSTLAPVTSDDEPMEIASSDNPERAVGGYLVRAVRTDAWDAIVALLLSLDAGHQDCFHAVMRGVRRLSNSRPEVDGLDDLLMEPEQVLHEVTLEREERRSQQGYSTPADARAFLQLARQPRQDRPGPPSAMNPVASAYFRVADDAAAAADLSAAQQHERTAASLPASDVPEAIDATILRMAGVDAGQPRALLKGARDETAVLSCIRPLMEHVRDSHNTVYLTRSQELAFLTNTLIAGCPIQSRAFTPEEASTAAVGICNLGLEHWPGHWPETTSLMAGSTGDVGAHLPGAFLVDHDLVTAFEVGWAVLHQDVSMLVAERLITTLTNVQCVDAEVQNGLDELRRELMRQRDAGTPWRAREILDVLATLDVPAWAALLGLLEECPVIPAAFTAIVTGQIGAISPTAFEFISTVGQIREVRAFMAKLPDTLGG